MAEQYKIEPLFNGVLLRPQKREEKTAAGIIIPDAAQELEECEVVAVGPGRRNEMGTFHEVQSVRVGDHVLLAKYSGQEVLLNGENMRVVREHDILARVVKVA